MDVSSTKTHDGHVQLKLGPVEKWILGLGLSALGYIGYGVVTGQDKQETAQIAMNATLAEVKSDIKIVTLQTSDLATIRADVIMLKLQVNNQDKKIETLEKSKKDN